jgi:predicted nuclease with TOPRIM domain
MHGAREMLDLRVVVEKKDVEKITRALSSLPLESEYGVQVSSIITSSETDVIIKAGWGCDILLLGVPKEEFLQVEDVGNIERIDVSGDFEKTKEEIRNAIIRSALHTLKAITKVRELKQMIKEQKGNEAKLKEELQRIRVSLIDAEGTKSRIEVLEANCEALQEKIREIEAESSLINNEKKRVEERNDILEKEMEKIRQAAFEKKELIVFRVEELWDEISEDLPPGRAEIEAAIKRLALEGKLFHSLGFIAAPSREEALDLLRIVRIAEDLKEE